MGFVAKGLLLHARLGLRVPKEFLWIRQYSSGDSFVRCAGKADGVEKGRKILLYGGGAAEVSFGGRNGVKLTVKNDVDFWKEVSQLYAICKREVITHTLKRSG